MLGFGFDAVFDGHPRVSPDRVFGGVPGRSTVAFDVGVPVQKVFQMLVFPAERIALLFTPKCGSNSIEEAYEPYAGVRIGGHPGLRHLDLSGYERGFSTLLPDDLGPLETVCLIRDPLEHLRSWYRYLLRPGGGERWWAHRDRTFDHFIEDLLGADQMLEMKTQHQFVRDAVGEIGGTGSGIRLRSATGIDGRSQSW